MPTDAEVEAAGEAMARWGMDAETLASAGDRTLLSMMSEDNRVSFLDKVRAGLEAAEAVREAAGLHQPALQPEPSDQRLEPDFHIERDAHRK